MLRQLHPPGRQTVAGAALGGLIGLAGSWIHLRPRKRSASTSNANAGES